MFVYVASVLLCTCFKRTFPERDHVTITLLMEPCPRDLYIPCSICAPVCNFPMQVKAGGWKSNMTEAVKILGSKKNLDAMFAKDFPFYLILAFRMHR